MILAWQPHKFVVNFNFCGFRGQPVFGRAQLVIPQTPRVLIRFYFARGFSQIRIPLGALGDLIIIFRLNSR